MKTARNDITGDAIQTRQASKQYADNYDAIFGKKAKPVSPPITPIASNVLEAQYEEVARQLETQLEQAGLKAYFKPANELVNIHLTEAIIKMLILKESWQTSLDEYNANMSMISRKLTPGCPALD